MPFWALPSPCRTLGNFLTPFHPSPRSIRKSFSLPPPMSRPKMPSEPDRSPAVEAMLAAEFPLLSGPELTQAITHRRILRKVAKVLQKRLKEEAEVEAEAQRQAKGKAEEEEAQRKAKLEQAKSPTSPKNG